RVYFIGDEWLRFRQSKLRQFNFGEFHIWHTQRFQQQRIMVVSTGLFHSIAAFVYSPFTIRQILRGFAFFSESGSSTSGTFWNATGRINRLIAVIPTEVVAGAVVAGYGPPCCIEYTTSTPVG